MTAAAISPRAWLELFAAMRWIAKDNPAAARALRDAVVKAAVRIGEYPQLGTRHPDLANDPYRLVVLIGFLYVIVYNADRNPPLIVRIVHGARDLPEMLRGM